MIIRLLLLSLVAVFSLSGSVWAKSPYADNPYAKGVNLDDFIYLDTKYGRSIIVLYPKKAPLHAERIRKLVREKFYDGLKFHRVLHGFMAQTGDPTGTGTGGSDYEDLKAEFNDLPFNRGVLGMARTQVPNSANSQFFICFQAAHHLNGQYTAFGRIAKGMEFIDQIKRGRDRSGMVDEPDVIVSMKMASDKEAGPPKVSLHQFLLGNENAPRKRVLPKIE